nr:hypothetical protein [uncultured Campylobacter sp.]
MNAWRYDKIDTGSTAKFNRCEWTKLHRHRCTANQILAPSRPSMPRQHNQAAHDSDTGDGAVKAAPKSLPSQQKEQRRHKKINATPRNAIKILSVASATTKLSM